MRSLYEYSYRVWQLLCLGSKCIPTFRTVTIRMKDHVTWCFGCRSFQCGRVFPYASKTQMTKGIPCGVVFGRNTLTLLMVPRTPRTPRALRAWACPVSPPITRFQVKDYSVRSPWGLLISRLCLPRIEHGHMQHSFAVLWVVRPNLSQSSFEGYKELGPKLANALGARVRGLLFCLNRHGVPLSYVLLLGRLHQLTMVVGFTIFEIQLLPCPHVVLPSKYLAPQDMPSLSMDSLISMLMCDVRLYFFDFRRCSYTRTPYFNRSHHPRSAAGLAMYLATTLMVQGDAFNLFPFPFPSLGMGQNVSLHADDNLF